MKKIQFLFCLFIMSSLLLAEEPIQTSTANISDTNISQDDSENSNLKTFSSKTLNAGDRVVIDVNGVEFAFRWRPAGKFTMGSPLGEEGKEEASEQVEGLDIDYFNREELQHEISLTKGFWMLETEVTQKQWQAVMGNNPSFQKDDDLPVEQVSWNDCQKFCKKCKELGLPVQLPTEAQWEYACRAGTTGPHAGDLSSLAWYGKNSEKKTHPVGTKKPNAWGLYDMHGNVYEYCKDFLVDYPNEGVTDPAALVDEDGYDMHCVRGGAFYSTAGYCRSANRMAADHFGDIAISLIGFRCIVMGSDAEK